MPAWNQFAEHSMLRALFENFSTLSTISYKHNSFLKNSSGSSMPVNISTLDGKGLLGILKSRKYMEGRKSHLCSFAVMSMKAFMAIVIGSTSSEAGLCHSENNVTSRRLGHNWRASLGKVVRIQTGSWKIPYSQYMYVIRTLNPSFLSSFWLRMMSVA